MSVGQRGEAGGLHVKRAACMSSPSYNLKLKQFVSSTKVTYTRDNVSRPRKITIISYLGLTTKRVRLCASDCVP